MQYNGIYTSFFWKKQGLLLSARKSDKKKTEILIIVMTANAFEEDRKRAIDIEKMEAVILSVLEKQESLQNGKNNSING